MDAPSMVQRSGEQIIVRSVVSGDQLFVDSDNKRKKAPQQRADRATDSDEDTVNELVINEDVLVEQDIDEEEDDDEPVEGEPQSQMQGEDWNQQLANLRWLLFNNNNSVMHNRNTVDASSGQLDKDDMATTKDMSDSNLPQCKIKRNYSCSNCTYFTQNPRQYLMHLRDTHGEKLIIHECKHCIYASRHYQKLVRHMKMVHGLSVDQDGSHLAIRKRGGQSLQQQQQQLQSQLLLNHFASSAKRAKSSSASSSLGADEINNNSVTAAGESQPGDVKGGPSCSSSSCSRNGLSNINKSSGEDPRFRRGGVVGGRSNESLADGEDQLPKESLGEEQVGVETSGMFDAPHARNYDGGLAGRNNTSVTCKPIELLMCANNPSSSSSSNNRNSTPTETWTQTVLAAADDNDVPSGSTLSSGGTKFVSLLDLLNGNRRRSSCAVNNNEVDEDGVQAPFIIPAPAAALDAISGAATRDENNDLQVDRDQFNNHPPENPDVTAMMMMLLRHHQQQQQQQEQPDDERLQCGNNPVSNNDDDYFDDDDDETDDNTMPPTSATNTTTTTPTTTTDLVLSEPTTININATINNTTDDNTNSRLLKCTVCAYETPSRELMAEHEAKDHIKTKFFRCAKCNYVTHIKTRFSKHVKYHSMPMIKCNMCDFRTPYKWNLDRHMKNHGGSGPFKCSACNFTADIKQSLTVHEMNHHDPPVGNSSSAAAAAGVLSHLQTAAARQHLGGQRRRNRVGGSDVTGANDLIAQQLADDATNDLASGLSFHFLEGSSMLSDHLKAVDLEAANSKRAPRPIPNLIPIVGPAPSSSSALNLCNKSTDSQSRNTDSNSDTSANEMNMDQDENSNPASVSSAFKKKHGSFFDKLKEKIGTNGDSGNLTCICSHVAKCLSELYIHRKSCQKFKQHQMSNKTYSPNLINKNSSRCQYCRHRCKSSADLVAHMQNCVNAQLFLSNALNVNIEQDSASEMGNSDKMDDGDGDGPDHPMENRIFVWNKIPEHGGENHEGSATGSMSGNEGHMPEMYNASAIIKQEKLDDIDLNLDMHCTFRQSPNTGESPQHQQQQHGQGATRNKSSDPNASTCLKKVFKCPHCSFWASTASRFHVHIVGHLNKKPFECSLCAYRSNWRWDITKHIRLKTIRDPSHKTAKVLMNDETGRRNYTKYNKYITLMKVTEGDGNLKLMKSGEMTPNQEASLQSPHDNNAAFASTSSSSNGGHNTALAKANLTTMQKLLLNDPSASLLKLGHSAFSADDSGNDLSALLMASAHQQQQQVDHAFNDSGFEKKLTSFKCKKCNFKHHNRSVVQEHVKGHYRDAGVSIAPVSKMPNNSGSGSSNNPTVEITPIYNTTNNNIVGGFSAADTSLLLANSKTLSSILASQSLLSAVQAAAAVSGSGGAQSTSKANGSMMNTGGGGGTVDGTGVVVGGGGGGGVVANQMQSLRLQPLAKTQPPGLTGLNAPAPEVCIKILPKPVVQFSGNNSGGTGGVVAVGGNAMATVTPTRKHMNNPNQSNDHGEMDEASSGGTTVGHNYRSQLSYRCGHCQQVSNWKHVIQRHCRLKHGGNINIEQIGKHRSGVNSSNSTQKHTTDSNSNILGGGGGAGGTGEPSIAILQQQLNSTTSPKPTSTIVIPNNSLPPPPLLAPLLRTPAGISVASTANQSKEMQAVQQRFSSLINSISSSVGAAGSEGLDAIRKKQYECAHCSYVTENKSQFSYHKSLHKPFAGEELKCNYCNYTASKRQLLTQHMRIHQSHPDDVIVVEQENHSVFPKMVAGGASEGVERDETKPSENKENQVGASKRRKTEFMCPYCPYTDGNADLVNDHKQFHLAVSNERLKFNCEFCDFNAHSEKTMKDHRKLHFSFLEKGSAGNVEFCTTYDKLKLFVSTTKSAGPSKDKKIYDEEEIEEENPWMHSTSTAMSSSSAASAVATSGTAAGGGGGKMSTGKGNVLNKGRTGKV